MDEEDDDSEDDADPVCFFSCITLLEGASQATEPLDLAEVRIVLNAN